ncbi:hypothetical protein EJ05DRAFT_158602 [Pseudovirgaria hyperparasitica]|uniref:Uncharacterized protein n=1 Tax=Pseudovirgaria hyperparasitica TaxID=470096 RepID=A0A6A6VW90_9PEZI|nr:uncharacterized protein EJ05DRAFT_158602 [Pseudovirgaria hyperparasitica]KAF2753910.1 hypothetical protein EJ05DRAFT_158602 [Pseudovirgaria hyperparasitica]
MIFDECISNNDHHLQPTIFDLYLHKFFLLSIVLKEWKATRRRIYACTYRWHTYDTYLATLDCVGEDHCIISSYLHIINHFTPYLNTFTSAFSHPSCPLFSDVSMLGGISLNLGSLVSSGDRASAFWVAFGGIGDN